jgi:hypothetical protein
MTAANASTKAPMIDEEGASGDETTDPDHSKDGLEVAAESPFCG